MDTKGKIITLLIADDDEDDRRLLKKAVEKNHFSNDLHFVADGEELMDYLRRQGNYSDPKLSPRPGLILLDLNMPRKNGREALKEIKSDPALRAIPIVILTTSKEESEVLYAYDLGANSFVVKPATFAGLVSVLGGIGNFWFKTVELPPNNGRDRIKG